MVTFKVNLNCNCIDCIKHLRLGNSDLNSVCFKFPMTCLHTKEIMEIQEIKKCEKGCVLENDKEL